MMATRIFAIDPGPDTSAYVVYNGSSHVVEEMDVAIDNEKLVRALERHDNPHELLVIEKVAHYGKPVGSSVFETCVWTGQFMHAWRSTCRSKKVWRITKPDVHLNLCHSVAAKDSYVRQVLIDRFGPGKRKAIGLKKSPGPLYGVKTHIWSALALAVTAADRLAGRDYGKV